MSTRTVKVDYLARVEGEGAVTIKTKNDKVTDVKLRIFEPPRFFEAFLRGRKYSEAPDITARICGICPIAYQMSSVHAMERIFGLQLTGQLRELRRLIYCGEWIESHVLHAYMLHAPDFLGYQDAIAMAADYPQVVKNGLKLKKVGNEIVTLLGGREIHPINVRVGGFYKVPSKREMDALGAKLRAVRPIAEEFVRFTASLPFPTFEKDYEFVCLSHPDEYPFNEGRIVSNKGLDIDVSEYETHLIEEHVKHSTALHSQRKGHGPYHVGPLARYNLEYAKLTPAVRALAKEIGLEPPVNNPFKSIVVRALETLYAVDEALRIVDHYEPPAKPVADYTVRAGTGWGVSEAPRGSLYHRYTVDSNGVILDAHISPPTAQNLKTIEDDLWHFAEAALDLPDDQLTWQCEQAIRNYDPCISCSVHFLKLEVVRE
ncbi:MAG: Ni/Fe hydrogenase subunit alpha [Aggregatilineales bacterium]